MPWSSDEGKQVMRQWLDEMLFKSVLDVGVGSGTYGRMIKGLGKGRVDLHGVEVWEPYIERFALDSVYSHIYVDDVRDLTLARKYDVVVMGDVIEHIERDEALAVIEYLSGWSDRVLVSLPIIHWEQGEAEGNPYEAHLHHWSVEEFSDTFRPVESWVGESIGVFKL